MEQPTVPNVVEDVSVRCATLSDLTSIVDVHCEAFPTFFLTRLGRRALHVYYSAVLMTTSGILTVAMSGENIIGFAAGTDSKKDLYWQLFKKPLSFGGTLIKAMLRGSVKVKELFELVLRFCTSVRSTSHSESSLHIARRDFELTSLAVMPMWQGRGCGQQLVQCMVQRACCLGSHSVSVLTDALNNEKVLNFYSKQGFVNQELVLRRDGRKMMRCWKLL